MENKKVKYLDRNWKILQERYPQIAEQIEGDLDKEIKAEFVPTREAVQALVVTGREGTVRLNSTYRPMQEAAKWADQYSFKNIGINVLMFGLGNGIFVRELLSRLAKDGHLFLVEPKAEILSAVLAVEDLSDILADERFCLYVGEGYDVDFRSSVTDVVNWDNLSTQIRCEHPGYQKLWPEAYHAFWDAVDQVNQKMAVKVHTNVYFAHVAVDNILSNLSFVRKSNYVTELMGRLPEELPAVVVAAGPSLDKNIEELRKMEGRALIIATDTAVRILEDRGIPYDCMVTVDPAKPAWYLSDYPNCADKPLFLCAEAQKEITSFHTGRKIWMPGSIYLETIYQMHGYLFPKYSSGGSVATCGLWIAKMLGLKNIVLIGQDLAFDGDRTHAGGHVNHVLHEEEGIQFVEGIDGGQVKTRHDWVFYLHWFEDIIQAYPELNVIDATEGGALIHGSRVMALSEVVDKYCNTNFSFSDMMDALPPTFDIHDYTPIGKEFSDLKKGVANILSKSREGIKYADEFISKEHSLSPKRHDRLIKEIKKANSYIARQAGYELVDTYTSELTLGELKDINCLTGNAEQDELNTVKSARALYKGFEEASKQLQKQLETVEL